MKTIKNILCIGSVVIMSLLSAACGNSSQKSTESGVDSEMSADNEENAAGTYTIVPVYQQQRVHPYYSLNFALYNNKSGQFVKFDNDADYTEHCKILGFITEARYEIPFRDLSLDWDSISSLRGKLKEKIFGTISRVEDPIYQFDIALMNGTLEYVYGNKEKITDSKIFKAIDKTFYDEHPDQAFYQLKESVYGHKHYRDFNNMLPDISAHSYKLGEVKKVYFFQDGTELPEGTLLFTRGSLLFW